MKAQGEVVLQQDVRGKNEKGSNWCSMLHTGHKRPIMCNIFLLHLRNCGFNVASNDNGMIINVSAMVP